MRKIVLTTGGTGGHIFPAIALAEELKSRYPEIQLHFIGSKYGPEKKLAEEKNIKFTGLPVRGFLGRGFKAVPASITMLFSFLMALKKLAEIKPDAITGFGGYASFASILAAKILNIPIIIHEQNAIAGQANKILGRWAEKICVSLPDTRGFEKNVILTGNPVRKSIQNIIRHKSGNKPHLLVLGGSQGAHALNMFIAGNLKFFKNAGIAIMHQTGEADFAPVKKAYEDSEIQDSHVESFISDMAGAYSWATLALCRSGASTAAELSVAGLPAVLVPFPSAIHNHQTFNAKILADNGAALLIKEDDLNAPETIEQIIDLAKNTLQLEKMSLAAKKIGNPFAAAMLANELENILKKN